jgi:hypothetical protein
LNYPLCKASSELFFTVRGITIAPSEEDSAVDHRQEFIEMDIREKRKEVKVMAQAKEHKCQKCGKTFISEQELSQHRKQC